MSAEAAKVAVFIDWQNTYKTAREAFGWRDYPNEYGNYSPTSLPASWRQAMEGAVMPNSSA